MALSKKENALIKEVTKRYGKVIDLTKTPAVLIEILRNFGGTVQDGDDGTGGVSPSSIAVAGPPPPPPPSVDDESGAIRLVDVMKAVLRVQAEVRGVNRAVAKLSIKGK